MEGTRHKAGLDDFIDAWGGDSKEAVADWWLEEVVVIVIIVCKELLSLLQLFVMFHNSILTLIIPVSLLYITSV